LIVSQLLTLYITPVVYLYLESFQVWMRGRRPTRYTKPGVAGEPFKDRTPQPV